MTDHFEQKFINDLAEQAELQDEAIERLKALIWDNSSIEVRKAISEVVATNSRLRMRVNGHKRLREVEASRNA